MLIKSALKYISLKNHCTANRKGATPTPGIISVLYPMTDGWRYCWLQWVGMKPLNKKITILFFLWLHKGLNCNSLQRRNQPMCSPDLTCEAAQCISWFSGTTSGTWRTWKRAQLWHIHISNITLQLHKTSEDIWGNLGKSHFKNKPLCTSNSVINRL